MGILEFFKSRIIRLHPLVILGSILGLLGFYLNPFGVVPAGYGVGKVAMLFVTSFFLIPYPMMPERWLNLFSFNAPAWSLFWEYMANVVYALVLRRIPRKYLLVLAIISAAGICMVAHRAGSLMGGWSGPTFWDGSIRISYSFLAGLLIYRFNWTIKNKLGFIGVAILLFLAFVMPFGKWNWLTEPLVVILYFPLIIALGADAVLSDGFKKICVFSGNISFPLYMTHYAFIWVFAGYYASHKPSTGLLALIIITGLIVLTSFAYLVMVVYDIPLRKYLNSKRKQS